MRAVVVVDTSIALKWAIAEPDSPTARALLAEWGARGLTVIAPVLLAYEIANVLYQHLRKGQISLERAREALAEILFPGLELDSSASRTLSTRAIELAHRFGLSAAYDPQYLALAEGEGCEYWTADERLWNSVKRELAWVRWLGEFHAAP